MIQGLIVKKVIDIILKKVMDKREIKKLRKYVEEDNELDVQMLDVENKCATINSKIRAMEDMLIELDRDSHPPKPFEERISALEKKIAK